MAVEETRMIDRIEDEEMRKIIETAKPRVAEAVMELKDRRPPLRGNGIFRHPTDWEENEINYIVDSLKANVPIHVIAKLVRCERHTLSKLINTMPELKQLAEEKYDNMVANAEFQADRLVQQGNAPMIMYVLDRLGGAKWNGGGAEGEGGGSGGSDRIVMGVIPDEEVKAAEALVKQKQDENGGAVITDPMAMAMVQETVKEEVAKAVEEAKPEVIEVGKDVEVSDPPYGGVSDGINGDFGGMYGQPQMGMPTDDPWASGGDSMFAQ